VIELLADGEKTCTELFEQLGCSQSLMSQQLKTGFNAGIWKGCL
jgi:DNA-binding transcriptional regulator GbsR (MarR family)